MEGVKPLRVVKHVDYMSALREHRGYYTDNVYHTAQSNIMTFHNNTVTSTEMKSLSLIIWVDPKQGNKIQLEM